MAAATGQGGWGVHTWLEGRPDWSGAWQDWRDWQDWQDAATGHGGDQPAAAPLFRQRKPLILPDNRFAKNKKDRAFICDNPVCRSKHQGRVWDGRFVDESWRFLYHPSMRYYHWQNGDIDATWLCTRCHAVQLGLSMEATRDRLGITSVSSRVERTCNGRIRSNPARAFSDIPLTGCR